MAQHDRDKSVVAVDASKALAVAAAGTSEMAFLALGNARVIRESPMGTIFSDLK